MARVCIVAPSSLSYMPYLRCYQDVLEGAGVPFDVLLWDRYGTGEVRANMKAYQRPGTARGVGLVPAYLGYRRFLLANLKAQAYSLFIVLGTQVGVFIYDFLRTRPYVLDVRDYSHEGWWLYRAAAFDLVRRAQLVCISSRGFLKWLPPGVDYAISHNLSRGILKRTPAPFNSDRKVLSYVGGVGYYRANVRFLEGARAQREWEVRYIGRGTCEQELEAYCRANGITNATFRGAYRPEEKAGFLDDTNFVLGIYGNDSPLVRTATPNRLYESCLHRRPIVVNSGTHLAELVTLNGLGEVLDLGDSSEWSDAISAYYRDGRYEEYSANCGRFIAKVEAELTAFEWQLRTVIARYGGVG